MGLFSLEKLFGMTIRESANDGSDFTNPDADYRRLFLGEDGALHVKDSAGSVTGVVTGFEEVMGADLTMTSANTYYDALSHSCGVGLWLFVARLHFISSGSATHVYTTKIWDGSTVWDEAEASRSSITDNGWYYQSTSMALVTLSGTTTVKVSCADVRATNLVKRDTDTNSATSHTATKFIGVKIA